MKSTAKPQPPANIGDKVHTTAYHLWRKRGVYYFRFVFPPLGKKLLKKSEIRLSLQTPYIRQAKLRARILLGELLQIWIGRPMLTYIEIRQRLIRLLQRLLEQDHNDLSPRTGIEIPKDKIPEGDKWINIPYEQLMESYSNLMADLSNNGEYIKKTYAEDILYLLVNRVFTLNEITDENALTISKAFKQMSSTYNRIKAARAKGDYLLEDTIWKEKAGQLPDEKEVKNESRHDSMGSSETKRQKILYSEAVETYVNQKIADGDWKQQVRSEHEARLHNFLDIIGDKYIDEINREDMRKFRDVLRKLPPNRTRSREYKWKSINEILDMHPSSTLNVKTINIITESISSLFEWCIREQILNSNPAKGLQLKDDRLPIDLRKPFTKDELIAIFSHPKFANKEFKSESYYWIPIISLYSGMRLEEISQLHCKDIYESDDGIWVFDINTDGKDEKGNVKILKTKNAKRIIPIHNALKNYGLLDYRLKIMRNNHIRLFPDLRKTDKTPKLGKQVGKQFKSVVNKALTDTNGKTFHSLRHTFADYFKQRGLQNEYFRQIFGHEQESLAAKQYGSKFPVKLLYDEIINKIDYSFNL